MAFDELQQIILDMMPQQRQLMKMANWSGVCYYLIVSSLVIITVIFVVNPVIWEESGNDDASSGSTATCIFLFFTMNMMVNYVCCFFTNTYYDAGTLTVPTADGGKNWGYCVPCQQYIPPRAHHCQLCVRCVLKRDVHCFFIGRCVGHTNQRFFLVFVFYAALSSLFALLCYGTYLNHTIGPLLSLQAPYYLYPFAVIRWFTGSFSTLTLFILTLFYSVLVICIGCCLLFFHHFNLVLRGQTSFESLSKNKAYDAGAQMNLREVFGRHWWLCFLLPLKLAQQTDGIIWSRMKDIKRI